MATPEERLAATAERITPCPSPNAPAGIDQCAHGTWPCAITEAAWLAQGRDRDEELRQVREALARESLLDDIAHEQQREIEAANREGRPAYWEAEAAQMEAGA